MKNSSVNTVLSSECEDTGALIADLFDSSIWCFKTNTDGDISDVWYSDRIRKILGFTDTSDFPDKIESFTERIHISDKTAVIKLLRRAISDSSDNLIFSTDLLMSDKKGEYFKYHISGRNIRRADGSVTFISALTSLNNNRQNTDCNSDKYRFLSVLDALADNYLSLYYVDLESEEFLRYESCTRDELDEGYYRVFGKTFDVAMEAYIDKKVYIDDRDEMKRICQLSEIQKALENNRRISCKFRKVSDGGTGKYKIDIINAGKKSAFAVAFSDIKATEDFENNLQSIIERNNGIISAFTADYDFVEYINSYNGEETVYSDNGKIAKRLENWNSVSGFQSRMRLITDVFVCPQDKLEFELRSKKEVVLASLRKKNSYSVSFRSECSGYTKYYNAQFFKIPGNELYFVFGIKCVDSEARSELEKNRITAEAKKARIDFILNMTHDFRTQLNSVIGAVNLALNNSESADKVRNYLEKSKSSEDVLVNTLNNIHDICLMETGNILLNEEKNDAIEFFSNLKRSFSGLEIDKNLSICFESENIDNRWVYMDREYTERILMNIIDNAVKYNKEGGSVDVLFTETKKNRSGFAVYRFEIRDTGIGMSADFRDRCFDEFARENPNGEIGGTGLGLTLAKSLCEHMGGTISCRSVKGMGSTFVLEIPFRTFSGNCNYYGINEDEFDTDFLLEDKNVLLVEDNELNREIVFDTLNEYGINAEEASNGQEAMDLILKNGISHYDMVLTDIQMPVMNGYQLSSGIRALYPESGIPIIAVSANTYEEDRHMSHISGMNDHLTKPIKAEELINTIKKYLL